MNMRAKLDGAFLGDISQYDDDRMIGEINVLGGGQKSSQTKITRNPKAEFFTNSWQNSTSNYFKTLERKKNEDSSQEEDSLNLRT